MRDGTEIAECNLFTENAPHEFETRERVLVDEDVVTKAQAGDKYALYHIVGGGGGHEIKICYFRIEI
jgi:hypothetical protein